MIGIKNESKTFGLKTRKLKLSLKEMRNTVGGTGLGKKTKCKF